METKKEQFSKKYDQAVNHITELFLFYKKNYSCFDNEQIAEEILKITKCQLEYLKNKEFLLDGYFGKA